MSKSSTLDQENLWPPHIKEEEEGPCSSQEELAQSDAFIFTPVEEGDDYPENQPLDDNLYETLREENVQKSSKVSGSNNEQDESSSNNSTALLAHDNNNARKRQLLCDTCGRDFKSKSNFRRHLRIHTGEKPYICYFCGKTFIQNIHLTIHMRRAHTREKPYVCKTCGKGFIASNELKSHMMTHSAERPFSCSQCKKTFKRRDHMTLHLKTNHRESFVTSSF